ncbi:GPI-anchored cell wall protein, putative [Candida dubliniensis CD36]|uniref:Protein involved in biofilm development, putative n=1 Tax=Candida dubliniensis (strain CD36 / ATCC MYA-646 / CBS 7987 / NCPF 3949 / NRRL Y-17841) TaxID=573826 RepID=B9WFB9_CANDC|nr:GPI-anchored cell wall protein, putative [Candida dubliniensis CD36]CAX41938.1 GPI-anchored cell wall protein, putative [Candida dubliniensis CD36]
MLSSSSILIVSIALAATASAVPDGANPYTIYPSVAKTASINGFADRIYDQLPECAKECVKQSTSNTPCPYWDTGCLCVMPQFGGAVGNCVAKNCKGKDVGSVESLATSLCSAAGVWEPYWMIPSSVSDTLAKAANAATATTTAETTTKSSVAVPTTATETSPIASTSHESKVAETSAALKTLSTESTTPAETSKSKETSKAAETTKAEESSVAQSSSATGVASVSVETANAGNMPAVAIGGVIAAVAALI